MTCSKVVARDARRSYSAYAPKCACGDLVLEQLKQIISQDPKSILRRNVSMLLHTTGLILSRVHFLVS